MKANIYDLEGKVIKEIELPEYFKEDYRPDLIKRAVISSQSKDYQAMGVSAYSNRGYTAEYRGRRKENKANITINTGKARLPRTKNKRVLMAGRVMNVSQAVGGPKAHPPVVAKNLIKKMNSKERTKAIISAVAATANQRLIMDRGHILPTKLTLPIIFDNSIEKLTKTVQIFTALEKLGLDKDIIKAKDKKTIRAGKGKMRGRKYKRRKSVLFVLADNQNYKAFNNLEGADVISAKLLSIKELAPGTHAGRLTIYSQAAVEELKTRFGNNQ